MKKILSLLMAVVMLFGFIPVLAEEGTFTANANMQAITAYRGSAQL